MKSGRPFRRRLLQVGLAAGLLAASAAGGTVALNRLDAAYPPPLGPLEELSVEVTDREGRLLRAFTTGSGHWRMAADPDRVDPDFVKMLLAYEDKRFFRHFGVDPLAILRAAFQFVTHGRIVSGGSTLTMQLARLLEPRERRTLGAKLRQMARAVQIERRMDKQAILRAYLTLAPYGGNIEGVRAASLAWFGKEADHLSLSEAALLVALPQAPEARRPDRHRDEARKARDRVIERMIGAGIVLPGEAKRVARFGVAARRHTMPALAAHLAEAARDRDPRAVSHRTTLDRDAQIAMERLVEAAAARIGGRVSAALVAVEIGSGEIVASVGSAGFDDGGRAGWIDMTEALRSPGSTLKPFIYGLAIENGLVLPETIIADRPMDFGGYRPANFDSGYRGELPVREALQLSLNVPAVALLDALGPARLVARFRRAGLSRDLAAGDRPGLSLALGGVSLTLRELVQLYANLATAGIEPLAIGDGITGAAGRLAGPRMISRVAAWHVTDMLNGVPQPGGVARRSIAFKTGTSYGYRDAWSVGFDGRHVIGIWVGRPDNGAVPGLTGISAAAPALFEAFERMPGGIHPLPAAPAGAVRLAFPDLPDSLRRFDAEPLRLAARATQAEPPLRIVFPPADARLERRRLADGATMPVIVKLQGGRPPFHLLSNGRPVAGGASRRRQIEWRPEGPGSQDLTVVDSNGGASSLAVRVY